MSLEINSHINLKPSEQLVFNRPKIAFALAAIALIGSLALFYSQPLSHLPILPQHHWVYFTVLMAHAVTITALVSIVLCMPTKVKKNLLSS